MDDAGAEARPPPKAPRRPGGRVSFRSEAAVVVGVFTLVAVAVAAGAAAVWALGTYVP